MAGAPPKFRHLGRDSAHRQALLRNLVTSLISHESIQTTWHKAKEAQRLAEKVISLGKRNSAAARIRAQQILFEPHRHMDRLFGELRQRYATRPGGYTRVLRIEPRNHHHDQADTAILELVDGPRDMRFAMTARTLVRERALTKANEEETAGIRDITARNILKVTRFRPDGERVLEQEIRRLEAETPKDVNKDDGAAKEPIPFALEGQRQGWERFDHFAQQQRRARKIKHTIAELEERHAEKQRSTAARPS